MVSRLNLIAGLALIACPLKVHGLSCLPAMENDSRNHFVTLHQLVITQQRASLDRREEKSSVFVLCCRYSTIMNRTTHTSDEKYHQNMTK